MKLRTTTPASANLINKLALVVISFVIIAVGSMQMIQKASADQYDDKISALKQDIARYQAEGERLNNEASTLRSALSQISNEKNAIQAQIDINQVKHDQLEIQISETEQKIKTSQDALGLTIAKIYVDDKITPLEMIAGSKTISAYMDMQEYRSSVRNELVSTISKIKDLKKTLDDNKTEISKILVDQKSQRDAIVSKENEQNILLQKTRGEEAGYQQLIAGSQASINEARATQALLNRRITGSGGYALIDGGSLVDYPWNGSNCPMQGYLSMGGTNGNGSDGRGYGCRQCASYVAWKIAKETGKYYSWGNAVNFTANATAAGYREGAAKAGSIAVMDPGKAGQSYGHVAWVESVNDNGTIVISQYNYNYGAGYGMYSLMTLSASAFDHYVHIK